MREKVVRIASDARTGCAGWFLLNQGALAGFTEPACTGWFLLNQGVLAGFYRTSVCLLVFTEPGCAGWFLLNQLGGRRKRR